MCKQRLWSFILFFHFLFFFLSSHFFVSFASSVLERVVVRTGNSKTSRLDVLIGMTLAIELLIVLALFFYATNLSHIIILSFIDY